MAEAIFSRADSTGYLASCPKVCRLEGLPKFSEKNGRISSRTSFLTGVVAALIHVYLFHFISS
jgi:hypothetical protein